MIGRCGTPCDNEGKEDNDIGAGGWQVAVGRQLHVKGNNSSSLQPRVDSLHAAAQHTWAGRQLADFWLQPAQHGAA